MASTLDAGASSLFGSIHEDVRYRLVITGVDDDACRVASFDGQEGVSVLFRYEIEVTTATADVAKLEKALGNNAAFVVEREGKTERAVHGIVTEVLPDGAYVGDGQARTVIVLEPRLANLHYAGGYRIFQNRTVKEIIEALLAPERIDVAFRLRPDLKPREYRTQRDESDLDFLMRLAADEGVAFFFDHEEKKTTLVLTNHPQGFRKLDERPTLPFREAEGAITGEHVRSIQRGERIRTGAVEHRDHDFKKPRLALVGRAETTGAQSEANTKRRERRDYPGGFIDPGAEGDPRAQARLEELREGAYTLHGSAASLRLVPGRLFTIEEHRDAAFNRELLVTRLSLHGTVQGAIPVDGHATQSQRGASELASFDAVPAGTPVRPPRLPKPAARLECVRVVGPQEGSPYVDEFGRIKVQFMWDREGKFDANSSCWVRMMTPLAHGDEGMWTAHKVGSEVLVDFIDGDIDRPVVVGAVYNGREKQPYKQPGQVTRSTWKVRGIPGGTGYNEITFENNVGSEQIILHAQKDLDETVLHSHTETIGADQTSGIGVNQKVTIGSNQTITVGADRSLTVGSNETIAVGSNETVTVGANRTTTIGANESLTVMGTAIKMVATTDTVLVGAARSLTAASEAVTVGARVKTVAGTEKTTVGGSRTETVGGAEQVTIGGQRSVTVTGAESLQAEKTIAITAKEAFQLQVGDDAMISMNKDGEILLKSGESSILLKKSGDITFKGKNVVVEASSDATLKGDNVVVKGSKVAVN